MSWSLLAYIRSSVPPSTLSFPGFRDLVSGNEKAVIISVPVYVYPSCTHFTKHTILSVIKKKKSKLAWNICDTPMLRKANVVLCSVTFSQKDVLLEKEEKCVDNAQSQDALC